MRQTNNKKLNLPDYNDKIDISKINENFEVLDKDCFWNQSSDNTFWNNGGTNLNFFRGTTNEINQLEKKDGQIIYDITKGKIYLDIKNADSSIDRIDMNQGSSSIQAVGKGDTIMII